MLGFVIAFIYSTIGTMLGVHDYQTKRRHDPSISILYAVNWLPYLLIHWWIKFITWIMKGWFKY